SNSELALTRNWTTWTKPGESDHRRARRNSSGIRSNSITATVADSAMASWSRAKSTAEARCRPRIQEYSALPPPMPPRKAPSIEVTAYVELPITSARARVHATSYTIETAPETPRASTTSHAPEAGDLDAQGSDRGRSPAEADTSRAPREEAILCRRA